MLKRVIVLVFFFSILNSLFQIPVAYALSTTVYLGGFEKDLETGVKRVYLPAGNSTVLKTITPTGSSYSYLHSDYLGSTSLITDKQGNVTNNLVYFPFGSQPANSPNPPTDNLYTGQKRDASDNLYYYNARYYNPTTGHFISSDPAQGMNRYAYVGNNPIMKNDPSGNCPFCLALGETFMNPDAAAGDLMNFSSRAEAEAYAAQYNEQVFDGGNGDYQVTKYSAPEKSSTEHLAWMGAAEIGGKALAIAGRYGLKLFTQGVQKAAQTAGPKIIEKYGLEKLATAESPEEMIEIVRSMGKKVEPSLKLSGDTAGQYMPRTKTIQFPGTINARTNQLEIDFSGGQALNDMNTVAHETIHSFQRRNIVKRVAFPGIDAIKKEFEANAGANYLYPHGTNIVQDIWWSAKPDVLAGAFIYAGVGFEAWIGYQHLGR